MSTSTDIAPDQPPRRQADSAPLRGLEPGIVQALQAFPLLSRAVHHLGRHEDVAGPLANMLNANPERLAVWEEQMASGQLDVNGLKRKLVTRRWYNPFSYPRG